MSSPGRGRKGRSRQRPEGSAGIWVILILLAGVLIAAGGIFWLRHGRSKEQAKAGKRQAIEGQTAEDERRGEADDSLVIWQEEKMRNEDGQEPEEIQEYQAFLGRMESVRNRDEIEDYGFQVIEDQTFPLEVAGKGEMLLVPALDVQYRRMVLFFAEAQENGDIVFRTERLETNRQISGSLKQNCQRVAAVSFPDIDGDGRQDVVLITICNSWEEGAGTSYKVGDVLFQGQDGFYQDWRLSERINRYDMNKSVKQIMSFAEEGESAVMLYTAATGKELEEYGFVKDPGYLFQGDFEKLGKLLVVPGYYKMAEYHIFMIYLINEEEKVVWNFQPMGEFENLYAILGIDCQDIDGDGLKDILVLARYTYDTPAGEMMTEKDYTIYYQRTGGFVEDTELKGLYQCGEETTMEELVVLARSFWGWGAEDD